MKHHLRNPYDTTQTVFELKSSHRCTYQSRIWYQCSNTRLPASSSRPLSVGLYNLTAPFDDVNGNIADIDYGMNGENAVDTTLIEDPGIYSWDITSLVKNWIASPATNNGVALSGLNYRAFKRR